MTKKKGRGFASMTPGRQAEVSSQGGKAAHKKGTAHRFTKEEAAKAGQKGGAVTSKDREHMAEIGRKGGKSCGEKNNRKVGHACSGVP